MLEINLNELSNETIKKYNEFNTQVRELINQYENLDSERLKMVKDKIEQTKGSWDIGINLKKQDNESQIVPVSLLLAYEYCAATEKITGGKVQFEDCLNKLFSGVQKFKIGNPIRGEDNECLYGKFLDDETAIPVTSKLYRIVMHAGAQHLDYFKDGKPYGAVFIFEKDTIKNFAKDQNGNSVDINIDGIDFRNLTEEQSLLTIFRQLAFHEWTHNAEKEVIEEQKDTDNIPYEYISDDGKKYRNYEATSNFVSFKGKIRGHEEISNVKTEKESDLPSKPKVSQTSYNITMEEDGEFNEPTYIVSTEKNEEPYYITEQGIKRPSSELRFGLSKGQLDKPYCVSTGMTTVEVLDSGKLEIHNILTEGWVETIARRMIMAIAPDTKDIDLEKYPEYVEMANQVITTRGEESTIADFVMHSSILKKELEEIHVTLEDGSKVDGLHYMSDYADKVQKRTTKPQIFYEDNIAKLKKGQITVLSKIVRKKLAGEDVTENEIQEACSILGKNIDEINDMLKEYKTIKDDEEKFFTGIPDKLGYRKKSVQTQNSDVLKSGVEATEEVTTISTINQQVQNIKALTNEKSKNEMERE